MELIEQLGQLIRQQHGCGADHVNTVHVCEERDGRVLWEGEVHVFRLLGHQRARRCFAWCHAGTQDEPRCVALLEVGHVDSARAAVRAAMVDESSRQDH